MTIKSMTGFARTEGHAAAVTWAWEIRSVNGRGLDLRLRLAPGYEALEPRVREVAARHLARGSISINLNVKRSEGVTQIRLNEAALAQALAALETVRARVSCAEPQAEALLAIRGVLEVVEGEESADEAGARQGAMLASLDAAFEALVRMRTAEGARLADVVAQQLASIEGLVAQVAAAPAHSPEAMRQKLKEQVARLLGEASSLDEGRLYQEAALLATKADVEEELQRLRAHIHAARALLLSKEPAGRRLDFLAQEFNREANTLCSKSADADITRHGLELKAVIDQMREQVQNIE
ncbi:MAG: YicC/YloC family endoribonuclease [Hyphomicrobiaceae bacterium]|nr:YicC/YloC family endoribonuclease [Hyphomicrobiaceae bacterium]